MCSRCVGAHQDVLEHIWSTYGAHIANGIRAPYVLAHISMCTICAPDMHQMWSSTFRCVPDALVHIRMCWSTYGAHMVHILQTVYVHHMCSCTSQCAPYVHQICTRCGRAHLDVFQMRWCTSGCAGAHMEHIWCTYCKRYTCTICARAHLNVHHMCTRYAPDVVEHI